MPGERIEVTDGPARGEQQDLENELVIGRSADGFGTLKGDPEISRRHAQISRTDEGRLYISDLGSTNGTFVNGNKIEGSAWLSPGDVVKVGQSTMKVGAGPTPARPDRPPPTAAPGAVAPAPPAPRRCRCCGGRWPAACAPRRSAAVERSAWMARRRSPRAGGVPLRPAPPRARPAAAPEAPAQARRRPASAPRPPPVAVAVATARS